MAGYSISQLTVREGIYAESIEGLYNRSDITFDFRKHEKLNNCIGRKIK